MAGQNRMTPVEAAKALGIRPQMVYGFIKHNRVKTWQNPSGKADLVDLKEVESVAKAVRHHVPKDESGKPVRRSAGVSRGTMITSHAHTRGQKPGGNHRMSVVSQVGDLDGFLDNSYVWTYDENGMPRVMYEENGLAEQIRTGKCHIESAPGVLGVLMFHWDAQGRPDLAAALRVWCEVNGVEYTEIVAPIEA